MKKEHYNTISQIKIVSKINLFINVIDTENLHDPDQGISTRF